MGKKSNKIAFVFLFFRLGDKAHFHPDLSIELSRQVKSVVLVVLVSHNIESFINLGSGAVTIKDGKAIHFKKLPEDPDKRLALYEDK